MLEVIDGCYKWGHTHFLFKPSSNIPMGLLRTMNRCVYVFVVSATIAPAYCLYHLFKGAQEIRKDDFFSIHFFYASTGFTAFIHGAFYPLCAIALISHNSPPKTIHSIAMFNLGIYLGFQSHQISALFDLKCVLETLNMDDRNLIGRVRDIYRALKN